MATAPFRFCDLPCELRDAVYDHILTMQNHVDTIGAKLKAGGLLNMILPLAVSATQVPNSALLLTSRQLRGEYEDCLRRKWTGTHAHFDSSVEYSLYEPYLPVMKLSEPADLRNSHTKRIMKHMSRVEFSMDLNIIDNSDQTRDKLKMIPAPPFSGLEYTMFAFNFSEFRVSTPTAGWEQWTWNLKFPSSPGFSLDRMKKMDTDSDWFSGGFIDTSLGLQLTESPSPPS